MGRARRTLWIALAVAATACRQLAGIEELDPVVDAEPVDASADGPIDGPIDGLRDTMADQAEDYSPDLLAPYDASYGCSCPTCTTLATGLNAPDSLAVVGSDVYFLNYGPEDAQGSLVRVPTKGGAPQTIAAGLTRPFSIATDATHVYFQAEDGKGKGIVARVPLGGGAPVTLASGLPTLQNVLVMEQVQVPLTANVAVTSSDVYFVGYSGGAEAGILSVPISGGTVSTVITNFPGDGGATLPLSVNGLATDGTSLYGVTNGVAIGVFRVPLSGAPSTVLSGNLDSPWTLALGAGNVYFADVGIDFKNGTLQRVPEAGGATKILEKGLHAPWSMAADKGFVYYAEEAGPMAGSIRVLDTSTSSSATLAAPLLAPVAVAVDATNVYWVDVICGTLAKVPR